MKTCVHAIVFMVLLNLFLLNISVAQIHITKPVIELNNNLLEINYDITGELNNSHLLVSLNIIDDKGKNIKPIKVFGDIGKVESTGTGKKIIWDLEADNFYRNEDIHIQVSAKVTEPFKETVANKNEEANMNMGKSSAINYKTIAQSTILPGWGLKEITNNKNYLIIGYTSIGLLAGSITFNRLGYSNYQNYTKSFDKNELDTYYSKAQNQKTISQTLAITGVTIWVGNIIYTVLKSRNQTQIKSVRMGASLSLHPQYNIPELSLNYRF